MSETVGSLYGDICNSRIVVSVICHPVMSAELLKSAVERAGRLKSFLGSSFQSDCQQRSI